MAEAESELEAARRHVEHGVAVVQWQHELIQQLRRNNFPTDAAELMLRNFEETLAKQQAHLKRLLAMNPPGPSASIPGPLAPSLASPLPIGVAGGVRIITSQPLT